MVMVFGDDLRRRHPAVATYAIAILCVAATVLVNTGELGTNQQIIQTLAFVPVDFSLHPAASIYTLVTAEFLHFGFIHLIGNLIFLIAFGRSIENLVGAPCFAAAFIGLGALSFLGSWLLSPASLTPIIGASGALSVLMAAYTVIFPRAKMRIIPFLRVPYLRAWFFATVWVLLQFWSAFTVGETASGVAYATHLGGFMIGLIGGAAWKEFALDTDRLIAELSREDTR